MAHWQVLLVQGICSEKGKKKSFVDNGDIKLFQPA